RSAYAGPLADLAEHHAEHGQAHHPAGDHLQRVAAGAEEHEGHRTRARRLGQEGQDVAEPLRGDLGKFRRRLQQNLAPWHLRRLTALFTPHQYRAHWTGLPSMAISRRSPTSYGNRVPGAV